MYNHHVTQVFRRFSIQSWLILIFSAFLLLVIISVGLTFWGLNTQKQDALILNLAGRQRMLVQQITNLALEYQQENRPEYLVSLQAAAASFEKTLDVLRQGGAIVDYVGRPANIPAPESREVAAQFSRLEEVWGRFSALLTQFALSAPEGRAAWLKEIQTAAPPLVDQADAVVRAFEQQSGEKITRLHWIQGGFLASGVILLGLGGWLTRRTIIHPLEQLRRSAKRIGANDLTTPVTVPGPSEVQILAETMEAMRVQLQSSHAELSQWVNTLEDKVWQRTHELEVLATVSQEITSHLDVPDVLNSVTVKAQTLLKSEVAMLCLLDPGQAGLRLRSISGPEDSIQSSETNAVGPQAAQGCDFASCPQFCKILHPGYRTSHMVAPLQARGQTIGALCIGNSRPSVFHPESLQVLTQLANSAAIALENSRLYAQAEQAATLVERQRIASDMHDGLLQTLNFSKWVARMAAEQLEQADLTNLGQLLAQIERADAQAEQEIRKAIASLQDEIPLQTTLQEQLADLVKHRAPGSNHTPVALFENQVNAPLVFPRAENEQILRVAAEALSNARRHSRARQVVMRFYKDSDACCIEVCDDGTGFSPDHSQSSPEIEARPHFGLKIMQARANRLGGNLQVWSEPGRGTRVTLRWPSPPVPPLESVPLMTPPAEINEGMDI